MYIYMYIYIFRRILGLAEFTRRPCVLAQRILCTKKNLQPYLAVMSHRNTSHTECQIANSEPVH